MKLLKKFLYILPFIIPQFLLAQDLIYNQYTTDDGLPSNTIYEIVQDSSGLMWMGTENGLVSYDGVSFERFSDSRMKDNDILKLEISKDGHVTFCNTSSQYFRLEGDQVKAIDVNFSGFFDLRSTRSDDFIIAFNSRIENNLYKYEDSLVPIDLGAFSAIKFDSHNKYLLYNDCEVSDTIEKSNLDVENYCFSFHGRKNINGSNKAEREGQFYIFRERKFFHVDSTLYRIINPGTFTYLFKGQNKSFVTTMDGLVVYDHTINSFNNVLQNFEIGYGFIDTEENIWLSTVNDGLLKIVDQNFDVLAVAEFGEDLRDIKTVAEKILAFSFSCLNIYDNNLDLIKSIPFEFDQGRHLLVIDDEIYVIDSKYIRRFDGYRERKKKRSLNSKIKFVKSIGSETYLADIFGHYVVDKDFFSEDYEIIEFEKISNISGINVLAGEESSAAIYLGTDNGLFQFDKFRNEAKSSKNILTSKNIRSLFINEDDKLWIGTSNDGLYSMNIDGAVDSIDILNCTGSNVINDIVQYDNYLFAATSEGLARYDLNTQNCSVLNEYRGLLTNSIRKILVKSLDSIFVTQNKELIMITNSLFDKKSTIPKLVLKNTFVNNVLYKLKEKALVFDHDDNNVEFQFDYYSYRNVGKKMLQYKLDGDSLWVTSNDLNLRFPSLEPNTYTLDVRGLFANIEHTEVRSFEFIILAPWWQTLWARLIGLLSIGIAVYLYVSGRSKRVQEQEALKRETLKQLEASKRENLKHLEASKREYLQQINKIKDQALQLQMNPHFIFNAMNAIQSFITSDREKDATVYLAKFAKLIRLIFEYSNISLISMEAELEFVKLYIDLEQLRFQDKITCILDVSKNIQSEKDLLKVPPLLIQPIIENSFKHGLFHKLSGGELKITYDLDGDTIISIVEDNGIGREASKAMQMGKYNKDRHSGLKNIMSRLEIFRFNNPHQENSLVVEDLYQDGKASGTKTILKITLDVNK